MSERARDDLRRRLEYEFADPLLLELALTHASGGTLDNQRLEFLGDAVLGLVVSDMLEAAWPEADEGLLSRRRAALVNAESLARKAETLDLADALRLGRGEEKTGGRRKDSILAGVFEAVLGAMYRDGGLDPVRRLLARCFAEEMQLPIDVEVGEYKTRLQELTQRLHRQAPAYELVEIDGPAHARHVTAEVRLGDATLGRGGGPTRKTAEREAAREALVRLGGVASTEAKP